MHVWPRNGLLSARNTVTVSDKVALSACNAMTLLDKFALSARKVATVAIANEYFFHKGYEIFNNLSIFQLLHFWWWFLNLIKFRL